MRATPLKARASSGELGASSGFGSATSGFAGGTGVAVATKGDQIVLPAGVQLRVRLTAPVTVRYRPVEDGAADSHS